MWMFIRISFISFWWSIRTDDRSDRDSREESNKIQKLVLEHCIVLEHANGPPAISSIDNTALNQVVQPQTIIHSAAASPTTPKHKCLFANMQNEETKKKRKQILSHVKDDILRYLKEDDVDSMFLLQSSNNYRN